MLCGAILGAHVAVATPHQYRPAEKVIQKALSFAKHSGGTIELTENPQEAAQNADFIYTDVWVSMGQEDDAEDRRNALLNYKINRSLLARAAYGCKVMHCLPAHREEEIDSDVMDSDASIVFEQAENRLHVQKALLCTLMGTSKNRFFLNVSK
jgi:ornithine carbamoyltransferase